MMERSRDFNPEADVHDAVRRTRTEVAGIIERFLEGAGGLSNFDDFCSVRIADPELDAIRIRCSRFHTGDRKSGRYSGPAALDMMRTFVKALRQRPE